MDTEKCKIVNDIDEQLNEVLHDVVTHSDNVYFSHEIAMMHDIKKGMRELAFGAIQAGNDPEAAINDLLELKEDIENKVSPMELIERYEPYIPTYG